MYSAEIPAADGKAFLVQRNDDTGPGAMTVVAILGRKGGVTGRAWLTEQEAAQLATAIMKSYRKGG